MSRGNRWEATYDPSWDGPSEQLSFTAVTPGATIERKCIVSTPDKPAKSVGTKKMSHAFLNAAIFRCRWTAILSPNASFDCVDLKGARGRMFVSVSVLSKIATFRKLCSSIVTSLEHASSVPTPLRAKHSNGRDVDQCIRFHRRSRPESDAGRARRIGYSQFKFVKTRAKIASVIYGATRNEADFEFYVQAYEQFTRCTLLERVERHRYNESTQQKESGSGGDRCSIKSIDLSS